MRRVLVIVFTLLCCASLRAASSWYLFVWAGDAAHTASDFLAVIDANPASAGYGTIVASIPTGEAGTHPHHTEHEMPANGHLLANGFHAGRRWLFDLSQPLQPRILTSFGALAGYSHPHTFIRLANGNVLTTFQYERCPALCRSGRHGRRPAPRKKRWARHRSRNDPPVVSWRWTSGAIRSAAAARAMRGSRTSASIPYSVLPIPALDRAVSTTTDMDEANLKATSEWVQFWRLSDLKLLRSMRLPPGPRGDEHQLTGEPRLLPDGKSIYIHTFNCGLYLLRGVERPEPTIHVRAGLPGEELRRPGAHRPLLAADGAGGARGRRTRHLGSRAPARGVEARRSARTSSRTGWRSIRRDAASCSTRAAAARATASSSSNFDPGHRRADAGRAVPRQGQRTAWHHADRRGRGRTASAARRCLTGPSSRGDASTAPFSPITSGLENARLRRVDGRWQVAVLNSTRIMNPITGSEVFGLHSLTRESRARTVASWSRIQSRARGPSNDENDSVRRPVVTRARAAAYNPTWREYTLNIPCGSSAVLKSTTRHAPSCS